MSATVLRHHHHHRGQRGGTQQPPPPPSVTTAAGTVSITMETLVKEWEDCLPKRARFFAPPSHAPSTRLALESAAQAPRRRPADGAADAAAGVLLPDAIRPPLHHAEQQAVSRRRQRVQQRRRDCGQASPRSLIQSLITIASLHRLN